MCTISNFFSINTQESTIKLPQASQKNNCFGKNAFMILAIANLKMRQKY